MILGAIHGVLLGVGIGLIAFAWKGSPMLGLILGVAMLGNMIVAGLTGAGIPLLLRRLGLDPAVSSAVFVTTITDIVGFLLFLGMAAALIGLLLIISRCTNSLPSNVPLLDRANLLACHCLFH